MLWWRVSQRSWFVAAWQRRALLLARYECLLFAFVGCCLLLRWESNRGVCAWVAAVVAGSRERLSVTSKPLPSSTCNYWTKIVSSQNYNTCRVDTLSNSNGWLILPSWYWSIDWKCAKDIMTCCKEMVMACSLCSLTLIGSDEWWKS